QGAGDAAHRRRLLPSHRFVRDDARRPSRHRRARRLPGFGIGRPRELAHRGAGRDPRGRRRDGPRRRRKARLGDDGARDQGGRAEGRPEVQLSVARNRRGEARLHRSRGHRHRAGRPRGEPPGAGAFVRRSAALDRSAAAACGKQNQGGATMIRKCVALLALLSSVLCATPAAAATTVEMTWMSIANWYFKIGEKRIMMDAYITRIPGPPFFYAPAAYPGDLYAYT